MLALALTLATSYFVKRNITEEQREKLRRNLAFTTTCKLFSGGGTTEVKTYDSCSDVTASDYVAADDQIIRQQVESNGNTVGNPIDTPFTSYISIGCSCDLGSVPMTTSGTTVAATIKQEVVRCTTGITPTYKWFSYDIDGTNEAEVAGQTSLTFSNDFGANAQKILALRVYGGGETTAANYMGQCRTAVDIGGGSANLYGIKLGGQQDLQINKFVDNDVSFRFLLNGNLLALTAQTYTNVKLVE